MKRQPRQIEIIRSALNLYWLAAGMSFPEKDEILKVSEEVEQILGIDPHAELAEAIKILNEHAKREREQEKANGDPAAILGYYENQIQGGEVKE